MDIELIVKEKEAMEKRLLNYINESFNDFENGTGLYPKNVMFNKLDVTEIGKGQKTLYTDCKIIVEV